MATGSIDNFSSKKFTYLPELSYLDSKKKDNLLTNFDGNKSFLVRLYSLIFIHSNSLTNPYTLSRTRNKFRSNFYFLYNSVYFTSYSKKLNKYKLSEYFSSKLGSGSEIKVLYDSKKKIGFGKLTWYWVFRMMSSNRFLLNFKEYRNKISLEKFSFYELALKSYEKNYNNWLSFANKSVFDVNTILDTSKNAIAYKSYSRSLVKSVLTNNRLRHKPISDDVSKTLAHAEHFKLFRRMPAYSQPSLKRFRRVKNRNIYFRKIKIFSKIWRAPLIRLFKKKSNQVDLDARSTIGEWDYFVFKKNIRIHSNMKSWEKKMKRSLWGLRLARNDYFGTASMSFTRMNYLSAKVLGKTKPSPMRDFSRNGKKHNYLNFRYRFPINTVELGLGYSYFNTFPVSVEIYRNGNSHSEYRGITSDSIYKKNLVKTYDSKPTRTLTPSKLFTKSSIKNKTFLLKSDYKFVTKKNKLTSGKRFIIFNKTPYFLRNVDFFDKFSLKNSYHNSISCFSDSLSRSKNKLFSKKIFNLDSRLNLLFSYKSKQIFSKLIFNISQSYFNFRFSLNKFRLDHLFTNVLLNSLMVNHSFDLILDLTRNRLSSVKQSLLFKLFSKMQSSDIRKSTKIIKKNDKKLKHSLSKYRESFVSKKFFKKGFSSVLSKVKKQYINNEVVLSGGIVYLKKKTMPENLPNKYRKKVKFKKRSKFLKNSDNFFKFSERKKKFTPRRRKIFKKYSITRNISRVRFFKNKKQLRLCKGVRYLIFEKKLGLEPLHWNKRFDVLGEVVNKFSRRRLLYFTRKMDKLYAGSYKYKNFMSNRLFSKISTSMFENGIRFYGARSLVNWYSSMVLDRRFSINKKKRFFNLTNSSVNLLFFKNKSLGGELVVPSSNSRMFFSKRLKKDDKQFFFLKKKELLTNRFRFFYKKSKFNYRLKPRVKERRKNLLTRLSGSRFFRKKKSTEWWSYANSKDSIKDRKLMASRRSFNLRSKTLLKRYFNFKTNPMFLTKLKTDLVSSFFNSSRLPVKKYKYSKGFYSLSALRQSFYSDSEYLENRTVLSRSLKIHKFFNKKREKFFRSHCTSRKTRLCPYIFKTLGFSGKFKKNWSLQKISKKSKYINSYIWLRSGLGSGLTFFGSHIKVNKPKFKRRAIIKTLESKNYYLNRTTEFKSSNYWNFLKKVAQNSEFSTPSPVLVYKTSYLRRFFGLSVYRRLFLTKYFKRTTFRKNKIKRKLGFYSYSNLKNSVKYIESEQNLISNYKTFENSDNTKILLRLNLIKKQINSFGFSKNLYFFKKIGVVNSTFLKNKESLVISDKDSFFKSSFHSKKFILSKNSENYFNFVSLNNFLIKNIRILNKIDYSSIFKKVVKSTKSKKFNNTFESVYGKKRKLNREFFHLFFFFNQKSTYLYRTRLLAYKKHLRRFGKRSSNIILKKRIKYYNSWRTFYMSSENTTFFGLDKEKTKYNFTKNNFRSRRGYNYSKKNLIDLRSSLRKNLKFLIKKKIKWLRVDKKFFKKKSGWSWKKRYSSAKKSFIVLKRKFWQNVRRNYKLKTMDKYSSFVGKRLVRRLKRRVFKRKRLFWTQKRFILYDANWKNFGYFWAKLSEDYNKYNLEFRRKTFKFPWRKIKAKNYFKKVRPFLWRIKNPMHWRKYGQYAKRFYPKFWYKVFRRKFPLKRHRKDWALKLGKMYANWQYKKTKQTFYDSSAVYFRNLSINVKPKRHRNFFHYTRKFKMQYIDRDLEIFDFEMDPKFNRKNSLKKGPSYLSWKGTVMYRHFKKEIPLAAAWLFSPTVISRKLSNIKKSKIDKVDFKMYSIFTKKRAKLLSDRFSSYSVFISILKKKILGYSGLRMFDYFSKFSLETKSISDSANNANITYFKSNSSKYSILSKNSLFSKTVLRATLLESFGVESANTFSNLNYKYRFVEPNNGILRFARKLGLSNYWNNLLYIYTSKYRHPVFENTHSFCRGSVKNNLLSLVTLNTKTLNKNYESLENLSRTDFKKLDFLKKVTSGGGYQFVSKFSNFFKKNKWIFSLYEFNCLGGTYSMLV